MLLLKQATLVHKMSRLGVVCGKLALSVVLPKTFEPLAAEILQNVTPLRIVFLKIFATEPAALTLGQRMTLGRLTRAI